jgi:hypothetical protein
MIPISSERRPSFIGGRLSPEIQSFTLFSRFPYYTGNLSPLADEHGRFGPSVDNADPWRERTRATRDFGEIADLSADYNAWRADRLT